MGDVAPWQDRDPNDEEEDDVDENQYKDQKDAILFVIQVSPSMVKPSGQEGKSALKTALECAYELLLQKIISNPNDMMGILFFGTEKTQVEGNYLHLYTFLDLDEPDAIRVKELRDFISDDNAIAEVCKPAKDGASMANVLFAANTLLTSKAARFGSKRVFLVTDDDSPGTKETQKSAITRARDLSDLGIRLEPFFISHPGKPPFDISKFYENIIYRDDEDQDDGEYHLPTDAASRFDALLSMIKAKQTPRRSQFNILMELGPGMQIGVKGFILVKRQEIRRSHYVYAEEEKPRLAAVESADIDPTSGQVIPKEQIQKAYKFGGELIPFTQDELKEIRNFGEPILRILGFKPNDDKVLRFWYNMRPSYFIYPSDAAVTGSTRTFASLHKKLLKDNLMGVGWLIARRNQSPVFVAIVPQAEELDERGTQSTPPGMHCIQLPFLDDIRQNPVEGTSCASDELINKMRKIVTALKSEEFDPTKFPNPALQQHYTAVQSQALDGDAVIVEDKAQPNYPEIHERVGDLAIEWAGELDREAPAGRIETTLKKRKAITANGGNGDGETTKIKKERKSVEPVSNDRIESLYEQGNLNTLKLDQLKEACAQKNLPVGKTKAVCIEALEGFFSRR